MPVAQYVFHAPDSIVHRLLYEINKWVDIVRKLDPSRPWISGDGETNYKANFPTIVGHYGGVSSMEGWASQGKPWGIGEQGMAYYGTPVQVSTYNGNRAYESQQGRMEGLADEAYKLIKEQRSLNASYSSIFNLVWYSLKPLALGMKDISRPTSEKDGIFFTHFKEGEPGMQPERIGPYTTTLNPGYDPKLPVFEPWPLFYAVKSAYATPIQKFSISKDSTSVPVSLMNFIPTKRRVLFLSPQNSPLWQKLKNIGLNMESEESNFKNTLILLDGEMPPISKDTLNEIKDAVANGGQVLVLGVAKNSLSQLNKILPAPLTLTNRIASSLIKEANAKALSGLGNADFYFTEMLKKPIMINGLSGAFVQNGETLLSACNTDWAQWNGKPEYNKTASVLKSERERKPAGAALVRYPKKNPNYYVLSLDRDNMKGNINNILLQMLSNLGATFGRSGSMPQTVLSADGYLKKALICGSFHSDKEMSLTQMADYDFLGNELTIQPDISQKARVISGSFKMLTV